MTALDAIISDLENWTSEDLETLILTAFSALSAKTGQTVVDEIESCLVGVRNALERLDN
jgi:hypothetical protein